MPNSTRSTTYLNRSCHIRELILFLVIPYPIPIAKLTLAWWWSTSTHPLANWHLICEVFRWENITYFVSGSPWSPPVDQFASEARKGFASVILSAAIGLGSLVLLCGCATSLPLLCSKLVFRSPLPACADHHGSGTVWCQPILQLGNVCFRRFTNLGRTYLSFSTSCMHGSVEFF